MVIPFPDPAARNTTIPFTRAELLEIAGHINSAVPEIFDAIESRGGSAITVRFLEYLWDLGGGLCPTEQVR